MTIVTTEESLNGHLTFIKDYNMNELIDVLNRKLCFVEKRFKMFGCEFILKEEYFNI